VKKGTLLDRIDYNIENMTTNVKAADKELIIASGYQKKSTKRKTILLLILCIIGMIILLTLKPKRHSGTPKPAIPAPSAGLAPIDSGGTKKSSGIKSKGLQLSYHKEFGTKDVRYRRRQSSTLGEILVAVHV